MIRGRLPQRFFAHGTDGSLSHAFSTALSTAKKQEIPCLVDKTVDNVDNFPGPAVDKWGPRGIGRESPRNGHFLVGRRRRVDRERSLGYNGKNGRSCRMQREERQNGT